MGKWFIALLMAIFVMQAATGCGQKPAEKKPPVIKPEAQVAENVNDTDMEEAENEETPVSEEDAAVKTVTESAVDKAAALQESQEKYQAVEAPQPAETLVVADFDSGERINNLGTNFGAWNKDPSDPTQWCRESFDNATRYSDKGFSMKLDYSVDSPNPAYNGFWLMLPNLDATKYDALKIRAKGDAGTGYTTVFKLELKNANKQVGRYYVTNLSDQWQEISIPLSEFRGLVDRSNLTEFVIVFEDRMASNKKGVIYVDDVRFTKSK